MGISRLGPTMIVLALSACGSGGTDISGLYAITSITQDPSGCGPGTTPASPPPFMRAKSGDFLGHTFYTVASCATSDPTSCTDDLAGGLFESIDHGWSGSAAVSSGGMPAGSPCSLTYQENTAVLTGDSLRVERKSFAQDGMFTACTTDEATRRGETMPCNGYTLAIGSKVK